MEKLPEAAAGRELCVVISVPRLVFAGRHASTNSLTKCGLGGAGKRGPMRISAGQPRRRGSCDHLGLARGSARLAPFADVRHESPSPSPRISFVVPVYGVERFLGECLESLLAHPGDDIEVVAVNDASPDGCGAILDAFAARDARVRPVRR